MPEASRQRPSCFAAGRSVTAVFEKKKARRPASTTMEAAFSVAELEQAVEKVTR
jgi:hypothetical protein